MPIRAESLDPIKLIDKKTGYKPSGFFDLNAYQDTRNFSVLTLNAKLDLPGPFSYFSLTNWQGVATGDEFFDIRNYLTEQNLYYKLFNSPFDINMQYLSLSGDDNDLLRFGIQASTEKLPWLKKAFKKMNAWYHISYFAWQIDHIDSYASQLQHVYYMKIFPKHLDDRVYLYGFADQNFNTGSNSIHSRLVAETQLGVRLYKGLHAVTEVRWNGFFPKGDRFGVGVGMQYKLDF